MSADAKAWLVGIIGIIAAAVGVYEWSLYNIYAAIVLEFIGLLCGIVMGFLVVRRRLRQYQERRELRRRSTHLD